MEADDLGLLKETNFQSCGEIESNRRFEVYILLRMAKYQDLHIKFSDLYLLYVIPSVKTFLERENLHIKISFSCCLYVILGWNALLR